jgi:fermentation-respiration switch protein FrsA (DUF1100 family)
MIDAIWSLGSVAVVYAGFCSLIFFRQARYVYYPDRNVAQTPAAVGLPFEDVRIKTPDGETVAGWFVPAGTNGNGFTVLDCHGNAGDIGDRIGTVLTFHEMGLNLYIFDYRGYGDSTGTPTEKGTYTDARAAWDYLVDQRGIPADRIVIFGRSLGGAVAAWLGTQVKPRLLVVESSFTSAPDMARRMFPMFPVRWLCRFRYDALSAIRQVKCPVIVAHSPADEMIPYEHGRRLFAAAPEPKQFVEIRGDHNAGGLDLDPEYQKLVLATLGAAK